MGRILKNNAMLTIFSILTLVMLCFICKAIFHEDLSVSNGVLASLSWNEALVSFAIMYIKCVLVATFLMFGWFFIDAFGNHPENGKYIAEHALEYISYVANLFVSIIVSFFIVSNLLWFVS